MPQINTLPQIDKLGTSKEPGPIIYTSNAIKSTAVWENSPDIAISTASDITLSENSVFIHPSNPMIVLNSNNMSTWPSIDFYSTSHSISTDGGQTWSFDPLGPVPESYADPATALGLNERMYLGYITLGDKGQGVAHSDDTGGSWTHTQIALGGGSSWYMLDKNHLWIDNSSGSVYEGNLYSAWTNLMYGQPEYGEIEISISVDDNVSWSTPVVISSAVGAGSHNQGVNIQTGPNGEVYVVWTIYDSWPSDETALGFAISLDGGQSWSSATRIITDIRGHRDTPLSGGKTMRHNSFPSMTVNRQTGEIFIVWTNIGIPGVNTGDPDIYMISSIDGGASWSSPIRVNQDTQGNGLDQYFPWIACDPVTGNLVCIYYDSRNFANNDMVETFVAVSLDDGATWEDFRVSDVAWSGDGFSGSYAGDYLGIDILDNRVYPVWSDDRAGNMLAYVSPFQIAGPPHIVSVTPIQNELAVPVSTDISVTFDIDMEEASINSSTFIVNGRYTGLCQGTFSYDGATKTATFDPAVDFDHGEVVTVMLTTGIQSSQGMPLEESYGWSFTVAVDAASPGTFVHDSTYAVGDQPIGIVAADMNGDGAIDLVTANATANNISVLLNTGGGTFTLDGFYTADDRPCEVFAADVDSDGDLDIVANNWIANSISVFANDGSGSFPSRADFPAGTNPGAVFAVDLDGDGDLDLPVPNWSSDDVSVLLNNGDGTFVADSTYPATDGPNNVYAADLDGDGDADLAITSSYMNVVSVYLNNGDGTFAGFSNYSVDQCPEWVNAADFDGDGDLDLATANKVSSTVSILMNAGDGTFVTDSSYAAGEFSAFLFVADYDGDSDIDLATNNALGDNASVLLNAGDGTFGYRLDYPIGNHAGVICAADFDNDGHLDLAAVNQLSNDVTVLMNRDITPRVVSVSPVQSELNVSGASDLSVTFDMYMDETTFDNSSFVVHARSTGLHPGTFSYDDESKTVTFNPDSDFDDGEVATVALTPAIESFRGVSLTNSFVWSFTIQAGSASPGTFALDSSYTAGDQPLGLFAADFNGSGSIDLATANRVSNNVSILFNAGNAVFDPHIDFQSDYHPSNVIAADFDLDDDLDLAVTHWDPSNFWVFMNDGNGVFSPAYGYPVGTNPGPPSAADLNGDGHIDLAVPSHGDHSIWILFNTGIGSFLYNSIYAVGDNPYGSYAADLDNDGDVDLAVACAASSSISVLMNHGNGTFAAHTPYPVGVCPERVYAADLNADGWVDLAAANKASDNVSVLLNCGDGTFGVGSTYAVGDAPVSIFAADFDGDNDLDIATSNVASDDVSVLFNSGNGIFSSLASYSIGHGPGPIFVADFDNDGDLDIAADNQSDDNVSILLNRPLDPPVAPALVSPANGSYTTDHTPTLDWSNVAWTDYYEVVVDNDPNFGSIDRSQTGLALSRWTVSPTMSNGTWYWKARAHNEAGAGPWSVVWHFTVYTSGGGDPSCPVLFSYNGTDFVQENPLLTACEKSGYVDVVTDYYQLGEGFNPQSGPIKFQIREMEDEVTHLHDIELITVDHADNTKVACSVRGNIRTYNEIIRPLSALDHDGIDRLPEIIEEDGNLFTSFEPGHLVVTFDNTGDLMVGFKQEVPIKPRPCEMKELPNSNQNPPRLIVEILDSNGEWIELPTLPSRENPTEDILFTDLVESIETEVITLRLSWNRMYSTDAIAQVVPSDEIPQVRTWSLDSFELCVSDPEKENWTGFADGHPLILAKGDEFEFSFSVDSPIDPGLQRDYIIRAVGRYYPDYTRYAHLRPDRFQLHENYPNPFNPATTISYDVPAATHVTLEIYNVLGQRVTILEDIHREPGRYQVVWDGKDDNDNSVSSGMYFYRLTAGDFVKTKKMLLLK